MSLELEELSHLERPQLPFYDVHVSLVCQTGSGNNRGGTKVEIPSWNNIQIFTDYRNKGKERE